MALLGFAIWQPFAILNFRNLECTSRGIYGHAIVLPCANIIDIGLSCWVMVKKRFLKWRPSTIFSY